jgi:cytochrome c551/c552
MVIKFPLYAALLALIANIAGAGQGLILQFGDADARIARQVALYVPEGQPASQFATPGQLKALWQGTLNLEARSRLIFTLEGTGQATLTVDGELLCAEIGTPSERKRMGSGRHAIKIQYTGPTEGHSQLRLFWEGRDFGREPIPAAAFSHEQTGALLAKQGQLETGHRLIKEHRCQNCHDANHKPEAPSLEDLGKRLETSWLARWIENPVAYRPGTHMPKLFAGADASQKAADIAHFLAPPRGKSQHPAPDPQEIVSGGHIFYQQGCIGCHTLEAKGNDGRIGLGETATKYRPSALAGFLREPAKHHATTRMPDFGFSAAESKALESFLRTLSKDILPARDEGNPERGKLLLKQSGCLNCHAAGKMKTGLPVPKALAKLETADCKAANYLLTETEQEAITAALNSPAKPHHIPAEFAQQQFITLRCAACHSRDGKQSYRETFQAEISHLKPPDPPANDEKPGAHKDTIPQEKDLISRIPALVCAVNISISG